MTRNGYSKSTMSLVNLLFLSALVLLAAAGCKGSGESASSDPAKEGAPPSSAEQSSGTPAPGGSASGTPSAPAPGEVGGASPAPITSTFAPSGPPDQVVAKVNGHSITRGELDFTIKSMGDANPNPGQKPEDLRKNVLDDLIGQELILQRAQASKVEITDAEVATQLAPAKSQFPDEKAFAAQLASDGMTQATLEHMIRRQMTIRKFVVSTIVDHIKISPEEEQKFYEANQTQLKHPDQIRASHILVMVKQGSSDAEKKAQKAKADEAFAKAKKGDDFAALARQYSDDGSKTAGGDLGFFGKGQMVPAFDSAAWALKPGEMSGIVESQFGFHIIKVTDKRPAGVVPMSEAKQKIDNYLTNQKVRDELDKLRNSLRSGAKVDVTL